MIGGPAVTLFDSFCSAIGALARLILGAAIVALVLAFAIGLAGCAPRAHTVVKTETVEVVKIVSPCKADAAATEACRKLLQPCTVQTAPPACTRNGKPELCNDQLLYERNQYRTGLALCDEDKTALREKLGSDQ